MEKEEMLSTLQAQNVTIYDSASFNVKEYIDQFLKDYHIEHTSLVQVGNPENSIDFEKEYREDGSAFCTVSAVDENGYHQLLSENEKGYLVGHVNEVRAYIEDNYTDGFYNEAEAKEKIEDYEKQFFESDEAYNEHLLKLGEEIGDFFDQEFSEEAYKETQYVDEHFTPVIMPDISPEEESIDLSEASDEEQIAAIEEAMEPGGKLWDTLRLLEMASESISLEQKIEYNDFDMNVSDKVKEYFRPTEEKQPYFDVMERGFIPFEIREGYHDNRINVNPDLVLTKEIVDEVRQKIDPDFGMIAGIDTTTFHVKSGEGFEKNISIIPMQIDEFKPYLTGHEQFNIEDIKYVRAIKEYGESMQVQGVDFRVNNLITFEFRTQDNEVYRSSLIMDDSGRGRARLDFLSDDFRKTFRIESGSFLEGENVVTRIHFDSLDRTNIENPNHFRIFEEKGEEFRSEFLTEVKERLPAFFDEVTTRLDKSFMPDNEYEIGRKDYMEINLANIKTKMDGLHYTANLTELYRESLLGKACAANQKCAKLDDVMNYADMDRKKLDPDSKEYAELTQKIETSKEEYAKSYHEYLEYRNEYSRIQNDADEIKDAYLGLSYKYDRIQNEYDKLMGRISANGSERDLDNSKLTSEERYSKYCDIALLRNDMLPSEISYDYDDLVWDKTDLIKDAYDAMEKEVDTYNQTVDHPFEKVQFMTDPEGIYTTSGYEVEAESISEKRLTGQQYEPLANREEFIDSNDRMVRKPEIDEEGNVFFGHADVYSLGKPIGLDITREEVRDNFVKNGIRCGIREDALDLTDHSLSGKMVDNDLLHEVDAIRMTVRDHQQEVFNDIEGYRDEIKKYKEELDDRTDRSIQKFYEAERDVTIESNEDKDEKSFDSSNLESKIRHTLSGLNGRIDVKKSAELSAEKKKELKEEASREAEHSDKTVDEIYKEKETEVKEKLETIRGDILHYREKMESFSDIPSNYLRTHSGYGLARTEYNAAIHQYAQAGGKVDNEAFVKKGVSNSELFLIKHEFVNTNLSETMVLDGMYGKNSLHRIKDVTKDKQGESIQRYSGMTGKSLEILYRPLQFISWPAIKIYEFISRFSGFHLDVEKKDVEKTETIEPDKEKMDAVRNETERLDTTEMEPMEVKKESMDSDTVNVVDSGLEQNVLDTADVEPAKTTEKQDIMEGQERSIDQADLFADKDFDSDSSEGPLVEDPIETDDQKNEIEQPEDDRLAERKEVEAEEPQQDVETREVITSDDLSEDQTKEVEKEENNAVERPEPDQTEKEEFQDKVEKEETEDRTDKKDVSEDGPDKTEKTEDKEDKIEKTEDEKEETERDEIEHGKTEAELENAKDSAMEESQKDIIQNEPDQNVDQNDQAEESNDVEKDESQSQDSKTDAMASEGEDLTHEDVTKITLEDSDDPDEEEKRNKHETSDEEEDKEDLKELLDHFSDVLDLKDTFEDLCRDTLGDILKGADPSEVLDALTDHMAECIGSENLAAISDSIYDIINIFGDSPIETLEHIMDRFTDHHVPDVVKEEIMERLGDIYDGLEGPFEDTAIGEIGDIEFTFDGTYQAVTGTEDLLMGDSMTLPEMETGAEQAVELEQLNQDLEMLQQANDIGTGLEAEGYSSDVAFDVSNDMFDQMQTDFYDGEDVFDHNYMDQIEQNAVDQAQQVQQQTHDVDTTPQDIDIGADTSMQDISSDLDMSGLSETETATELSEVAEELAALL